MKRVSRFANFAVAGQGRRPRSDRSRARDPGRRATPFGAPPPGPKSSNRPPGNRVGAGSIRSGRTGAGRTWRWSPLHGGPGGSRTGAPAPDTTTCKVRPARRPRPSLAVPVRPRYTESCRLPPGTGQRRPVASHRGARRPEPKAADPQQAPAPSRQRDGAGRYRGQSGTVGLRRRGRATVLV